MILRTPLVGTLVRGGVASALLNTQRIVDTDRRRGLDYSNSTFRTMRVTGSARKGRLSAREKGIVPQAGSASSTCGEELPDVRHDGEVLCTKPCVVLFVLLFVRDWSIERVFIICWSIQIGITDC